MQHRDTYQRNTDPTTDPRPMQDRGKTNARPMQDRCKTDARPMQDRCKNCENQILKRVTSTENIRHRTFTRRQEALQNTDASNIDISQNNFSDKVLKLFSRS